MSADLAGLLSGKEHYPMLRFVWMVAVSLTVCVFSGSASAGYIAMDKGSNYATGSSLSGQGQGVGWGTNWRGSSGVKIENSTDIGMSFSAAGSTAVSRMFAQTLVKNDHLTVDFDPGRNTYVGIAEGTTSSTSTLGGMRLMASGTGSNLILRDISGDRTIGSYVDGGLRIKITLVTDNDFRLDGVNLVTGASFTTNGSFAAFPNTFEFGASSAPTGVTGYANNLTVNVPEPTAIGGIGLGALGLLARRRRYAHR